MNHVHRDHRPYAGNAQTVVYFDDARSVAEGLRHGDPSAAAALYDNYAPYIRRILARILGVHSAELDDCLQETFTNAFFRAAQLRNADFLKTWLTRIAICSAIDQLRKKKRERWLRFMAPEDLPDPQIPPHRLEDTEALRAVYQLLERMPAKERVPFTLRQLEKMPLADIAEVTGVSLATTKRRIGAATARFESLAERCAPLESWLNEQGHWRQ
jgi:RNA polymerase sigma-70 factor (ECF subfamily)